MDKTYHKKVVIIGAGPAGLSAACKLLEYGFQPVVIEEAEIVGGISKTVFHEKNGTDIGPHRFFTKSDEVMDFVTNFLKIQGKPAKDDLFLNRKFEITDGANPQEDDFVLLKRKRFSRIYYNNKFFDYPIKLNFKFFRDLGLVTTFKIGFSYLKSCIFKRKENSLEDFIINRFGQVLYELFFKQYTQKVWGKSPSEIPKDWGVQRIKSVSVLKILQNAILAPFKKIFNTNSEVSLIDEYYYPKWGIGQLWNLMAEKIINEGGEIRLNSKAERFYNDDNKMYSVVLENGEEIKADYIVSTMPIKDLIKGMQYVPKNILEISDNLEYRNYILVSFLCSKFNLKNNTNYPTINNISPDSWIYLQDNNLHAGRLHIMNNFSPYVIDDYKNNVLVNLEYFCNEYDDLWNKDDDNIIDLGISELKKLGIINKNDILYSNCIKVNKAYPAYFGAYKDFEIIKDYINKYENLYCIGRNGQHKYNNMDHSILSGIKVAEIIANKHDKTTLWQINTDNDYQESKNQ